MNNINNLLQPKCDKCEFLDIETSMTTAYGNNEILEREIYIDCQQRAICNRIEKKLQEEKKVMPID